MSGYINGYLMASGDTHSTRAPFGLRPTPSLTRQLLRLVGTPSRVLGRGLQSLVPVGTPIDLARTWPSATPHSATGFGVYPPHPP